MPAYGFQNIMGAISGRSGAINIGAGSANAEGGISIVYTEDKNTMTVGADGEVMHSLHAGKSGTVTVRLLKTAPANGLLDVMYILDTAGTINHGRNTISFRDLARGDTITCQECAFAKHPDVVFAKDGGEMVWTFHAGKIDMVLGTGLVQALVA